jgi:hypothetical protein
MFGKGIPGEYAKGGQKITCFYFPRNEDQCLLSMNRTENNLPMVFITASKLLSVTKQSET